MKRKMLFAIRRLWFGPPTTSSYCAHTCVLCGQTVSHYRIDCAETRLSIYASHPDCRPEDVIRDFYSTTARRLKRVNDAHLGAVEGDK